MVGFSNPVVLGARPARGGITAPAFPPFSPADITGLKMWVKADSLGLSDGATVASWTDSSGNGNTAAQATEGNKPTYQTNELNGLPVVRFDGADDCLVTANFASALVQPTTWFVVGKTTTSSEQNVMFSGLSPEGRQALFVNDGWVAWELFTDTEFVPAGAVDFNNHVFTAQFNGASSKLYIGGGTPTTGNAGTGSLDGVTVGALPGGITALLGDIAELLLYDSALAVVDHNRVGNYLASKYALSWVTVV